MRSSYDDVVVGAGIVGLAHALQLGRRGRRVAVVERSPRAMGASVRNFGMLWPIGQPAGPRRDLALRSRALWFDVLDAAGLWHDCCGSLHLAYRDDEARVLREFADRERRDSTAFGGELEWLAPDEVAHRAPLVRIDGLVAALFSPWEACVDPREVVGMLPAWLEQAYGVAFVWSAAVLGYEGPRVRTSAGDLRADRLWIASGDDVQTLYPEAYAALGLRRCKLQMMRTGPLDGGRRIGPMLAAGLTLRHYRSFEGCPTLPALRTRIAEELPAYDAHGIHVMASQNGRGEVVLGDSHEYDGAIGPFDRAEIDGLILDYLATFLPLEGLPPVAERWHGLYVAHPTEPWVVVSPAPGVTAVTGLGGAGMTLSMGLAERVVDEVLGRG